jgi:hypothetical protein
MYSINSLPPPPALGDAEDIPDFSFPLQLGQFGFHLPQPVKQMVGKVEWEWFREVSSRIARQYRRLRVGEGEWVKDISSRPLLVDQTTPLPEIAGAHAWLMAVAQQAGMEVRDAELEVLGTAGVQRDVFEIAGVATLAGVRNPRGTGRKLNAILSALAADLLLRCQAEEPAARIQFIHRKALQIKSPVNELMALPIAAYVIRFVGVEAATVMAALQNSLAAVTEAMGEEMRESVLVLNPALR